MEKLNVAVIFGGCSPEYSVSLESAHAVITHMDRARYNPVLVGISSAGNWYHFTGDVEKIRLDTWNTPADCTPALVSPDQDSRALLVLKNGAVEKITLDAAFPVLHGRNGEDGTMQGLLELAGIPLVGCGVLASALCMDKDRAHKLAQAAGITIPSSTVLTMENSTEDAFACADQLGYPLFVKPLRAGSSYGITKVTGRDELPIAIKLAFEYDSHIILEEAISGFEVGCAVLGNDTLTVGELDEIELADVFFNFTEKYTLKTSAIQSGAGHKNSGCLHRICGWTAPQLIKRCRNRISPRAYSAYRGAYLHGSNPVGHNGHSSGRAWRCCCIYWDIRQAGNHSLRYSGTGRDHFK